MNVRDAFFSEIDRMVRDGEDIIVVTSDIAAPSLDDFRKDFPNRFVSVGIAEQNLIAVAAGLVCSGKKVIAYGLNPFPATRAFDQIRNFMADLRLPIVVAALNSGTCSAEAGFTHMPIEDVAMLRTLKNIRIVMPGDETTAKAAARRSVRMPEPMFIRFDKDCSGKKYEGTEIEIEKGYTVLSSRPEEDIIVIVQSSGSFHVKELLLSLEIQGLKVKIIEIFSLPVMETGLINEIKSGRVICTVEDNVLPGGIGSMVAEILADHEVFLPIKRLGLSFESGYPEYLANRNLILEKEGLTTEKLVESIVKFSEAVNKKC